MAVIYWCARCGVEKVKHRGDTCWFCTDAPQEPPEEEPALD